MPFNKIKKMFNKKEDQKPLLKDSVGPSKQEIEAEKEKEKLEQFLKKYNLDKQNIDKFHKYAKNTIISIKEVKNKQCIEDYFTSQIACVDEFHDSLINQYNLEKDMKDIAKTASRSPVSVKHDLSKFEKEMAKIKKNIEKCVKSYAKSKSIIKKRVGFEDKRSNLTIKGLILSN